MGEDDHQLSLGAGSLQFRDQEVVNLLSAEVSFGACDGDGVEGNESNREVRGGIGHPVSGLFFEVLPGEAVPGGGTGGLQMAANEIGHLYARPGIIGGDKSHGVVVEGGDPATGREGGLVFEVNAGRNDGLGGIGTGRVSEEGRGGEVSQVEEVVVAEGGIPREVGVDPLGVKGVVGVVCGAGDRVVIVTAVGMHDASIDDIEEPLQFVFLAIIHQVSGDDSKVERSVLGESVEGLKHRVKDVGRIGLISPVNGP